MANATFFSPDGGITRYPLEDTEGRIMYADDIDGINQVKIFHPSQTINGITFTVSNGKIIASGTATDTAVFWCSLIDDHYTIPAGNYHASGCPEQPSGSTQYHIGYLCTRNGSDNVYGNETGNGLDFEVLDGDVNLRVGIAIYSGYAIQGTLVFEPMLTEAKYAGIPYRPYNQQSIQHQINAQTGVLGAKNLLENINTTYTEEGATWTVNGNKTVTINKPNASTNSSYMRINYASDSNHSMALDAAPYIGKLLKASFLDSAINGIGGRVGYFTSGSNTFNAIDDYFSTSKTFTVPSNAEKIVMYLRVDASVTISNVTVKPMLRLASDPSDEYVPYVMTNRELTEKVQIKHFEIVNMNTDNDGLLTLPSVSTDIALLPSRITVPGGLLMPCATSISDSGKLLIQFFNKNTAQFVTTSVTVNGTLNYIEL